MIINNSVVTEGRARTFMITGSLVEGSGPNILVHILDEVAQAHNEWMYNSRVIIDAMITPAFHSRGWCDNGCLRANFDEGWVLQGGFNPPQNEFDDDDEQERDHLLSLASFIRTELRQTRLFVYFGGKSYVVEDPDITKPTEAPIGDVSRR